MGGFNDQFFDSSLHANQKQDCPQILISMFLSLSDESMRTMLLRQSLFGTLALPHQVYVSFHQKAIHFLGPVVYCRIALEEFSAGIYV